MFSALSTLSMLSIPSLAEQSYPKHLHTHRLQDLSEGWGLLIAVEGGCTGRVQQGADLDNKGVTDHLHHHDVVVGLGQAHPGAHAHSLVQQGVACAAYTQLEAMRWNSEGTTHSSCLRILSALNGARDVPEQDTLENISDASVLHQVT